MALQYSQILISILLAFSCYRAYARIEYGPLYGMKPEISSSLMEDYNNADSDEYSDMVQRKFDEQNPNFLANWPYLKDLIPPEYEGSTNRNNQIQLTPRPIYSEMSEILPTPQPQKMYPPRVNDFKENWDGKNYKPQQKKNSNSRPHYMSACHFKICNLGRKRNVRFVNL